MDFAVLAGRLDSLAVKIERTCHDHGRWSRPLYDGPGSIAFQLRQTLELWRLELEAIERALAHQSQQLDWERRHWRTPASAVGKALSLERARNKLCAALAKLVDVAKGIAEVLKSVSAGAGKDALKSIRVRSIPAELKQKIAANPPDGTLTVVLGAALLWEWIKKLREPRSDAAPAGSAGR